MSVATVGTVQDDAVFDTLESLVKEGKVRHVGIALGPDIGWFDEGETAMRERNISSLQVIYSIIEQQPARQFFPIAGEQKTGLLARVPHASEILTDAFTDKAKVEFDPSDHRAHRKQEWLDKAFQKRDKVLFIAQDTGRTLASAHLLALLQPKVPCTRAGTGTPGGASPNGANSAASVQTERPATWANKASNRNRAGP